MSFDDIVSRLDRVAGKHPKYRAPCPAHGAGKKLTLVISEREDGSTGIFCHAGCTPAQVLEAIGLDERAAWRPRPNYHTPQHRAACERSQRIIAITIAQRKGLAGISAYLAQGKPCTPITLRRYDEIVTDLFFKARRTNREAKRLIDEVQHEAIVLALVHGGDDILQILNAAMYRCAVPGDPGYRQEINLKKA